MSCKFLGKRWCHRVTLQPMFWHFYESYQTICHKMCIYIYYIILYSILLYSILFYYIIFYSIILYYIILNYIIFIYLLFFLNLFIYIWKNRRNFTHQNFWIHIPPQVSWESPHVLPQKSPHSAGTSLLQRSHFHQLFRRRCQWHAGHHRSNGSVPEAETGLVLPGVKEEGDNMGWSQNMIKQWNMLENSNFLSID
jgi:hypothetical protein